MHNINICAEKLDMEWRELILTAYDLGITSDEIRKFLHMNVTKTKDDKLF